jgi:hypothetical protein
MNKWLTFLAVLALLAGTALAQTTQIPASEDVYLSMEEEAVYGDSDILRCEVQVSDINGTNVSAYTGVPMVQFDISSLNLSQDEVAIMVLKASSIEKGNDSAMIALMPVASQWTEKSDYVEMVINLLPIWNIVKNNDVSQMGINTDGDQVLAFDVSQKLKDAKLEGDRASFLLMAISNSTYSVDFMSRETGQGPYLMVMPYAAEEPENQTVVPPVSVAINETTITESALNETLTSNETLKMPENISLDMALEFPDQNMLNLEVEENLE